MNKSLHFFWYDLESRVFGNNCSDSKSNPGGKAILGDLSPKSDLEIEPSTWAGSWLGRAKTSESERRSMMPSSALSIAEKASSNKIDALR